MTVLLAPPTVAWNAARLVAVRRSLDVASFWAAVAQDPGVDRDPNAAPLGLE